MCKFPLLFLLLLCCNPCCAGITLFVGSYNHNASLSGIYVFDLDTTTGKLTAVTTAKNVLNPAYLALSPDGKYIYACTEARIPGGGKIRSYRYSSDCLQLISEVSSEGENPVYLTLTRDKRWLMVANYTAGTIAALPVSTNGYLERATQVITLRDSSINRQRQESAHPHAAVLSPDGNKLFVPDLGSDKIWCYAIGQHKMVPLNPAATPATKTVKGSGPRHLTFSPNGRFAYCVEELAGTVTAYSYNNGRLDSIQRIVIHKGHHNADYSSADIHCTPDGRFLYASNRSNENNIAILNIDSATGKLSLKGYTPVHGDHPRSFAIDPSGKFLIVANQISGNLSVFKINKSTGMLKYIPQKINVPGASCVKISSIVP